MTLNASTLTLDPVYNNAIGNVSSLRAGLGTYTYGAGSAGPHAVTTIGSRSYGYDLNGNMTSRNGKAVTWTSFNAPKRITTSAGNYTDFFYDPFRGRPLDSPPWS